MAKSWSPEGVLTPAASNESRNHGSIAAGKPAHGIHDTQPAERWEDAFLSGNGEYGIMVFGDPHRERIIHNHHRYVLPNASGRMSPRAVADQLEHVRDLILAGEREQAQHAFSDGRRMEWTQPFHPGHVLHLEAASAEPVHDYRRSTDFHHRRGHRHLVRR